MKKTTNSSESFV